MEVAPKTLTFIQLIRLIVVLDAVLVVVCVILAALIVDTNALIGVGTGGALGTVNLLALAWLCRRAVSFPDHRWRYLLAMGAKFIMLVVMVFAAIHWIPMDLVGFVIGLSAAGLAIVIGTSWVALQNVELTV